MASGRPGDDALVFPAADGEAWTKDDWDVFRANGWKTACKHAGLVPAPRPYDLRHSFASLLLAEGRTVHYVATQLGHSPVLTLSTYGHLIAEYADAGPIDAEHEIMKARTSQSATARAVQDGAVVAARA
jgi:integrase